MIGRRLGAMAIVLLALLLAALGCCCGIPEAVREGTQMEWPWSGLVVRGSGNVIEVPRDAAGFSGVSLRGVGRLLIEQGETESVLIQAEDNIVPYLETRVEGSSLVIGTKPGTHLRPTRPIIFRVTVRDLDHLKVSGSGDVAGANLQAGSLVLTVSGSGDMDLAGIQAESIEASVSGSGTIDVEGETTSQDLRISGSGDYRAGELQSSSADARISGSGSAVLNVSDQLEATITGSGSIRYLGSPSVQSSVTGSGTIRPVD